MQSRAGYALEIPGQRKSPKVPRVERLIAGLAVVFAASQCLEALETPEKHG
jgi:hypothetical protein